MAKDVIYIDVEDDITTIVGKIKASKEKIIALVPPSRVGVLQSAVNMRLLHRAAELAGKRVVLISSNPSLAALASAAKIPVARTLQSKPELVEVPVLKIDGDDIIDGGKLPIGEIARAAKSTDKKSDTAINAAIMSSAISESAKSTGAKKKSDQKVPNFSSFRKKLFIIGTATLAVIAFVVWAVWFAPRATVTITAKTTNTTIDRSVTLTTDGETSVQANTVRALRQQQQSEASVEFRASGEKNVGEKATGSVRFSTRRASDMTIPAGTLLSAGGFNFRVESDVTVPAATLSFECGGICPGTVDGEIVAAEGGEKYNGVTGSVSGTPSGVSATLQSATSGGTDRMATVVSEEDIEKATAALAEETDEELRTRLESAFGSSSVVISESYTESRSKPSSSVAVDAEASGSVTLKTTITATMLAIDQVDLEKYLDGNIALEIEGQDAQKIYENGADEVRFSQFTSRDDTLTVRITANGLVGPEIEETRVKEQARGRSYGDIQASLESIQGVDDVDTQFWPFWVRTVPDNVDRINVEFKLEDAS